MPLSSQPANQTFVGSVSSPPLEIKYTIEMDKNKLIKDNLVHHINNSIKLFQEQFSFPNLLQHEIDNLDNIIWLPNPELDAEGLKDEHKNELIELLNDNHLHVDLENLIGELVDVNEKSIQDHIEHQLIDNLSNISLGIPEERRDFKLNLLFLEHDYEPESSFCGFDDQDYEFKILSGQEYLKYNYEKALFSSVGKFDYTPFLHPFLKFEETIGEERVDMINEALSMGAYLEEIKKLFLLNGFLGIHTCLGRIKDRIREINIPMSDEVFVFGNEHDCEQLNIYVL